MVAAVLAAVALTPFASGLNEPVHLTAAPGEKGRLYVVEQRGVIKVLVGRTTRARPFLNIASRVSSGVERGLLSVAFHPNYVKNRRFFVYYTDPNGDTRVVAYRSNGTVAIPSSARLIFFEKQPSPLHNGGQLVFGPDRLLYIGLGDGGPGGDPDNHGQTMRTKLAKIWKLDVDRPGAKPELVAYGLRNPWRFSFDRANGDLYIADVGQGEWEEIDYVARSDRGLKNFGWAAYEGNERFDDRPLLERGKLTAPIAVYGHDEGCGVTGGFVYRGKQRPTLQGRYFYGDYCSGFIWSLRVVDGKATDVKKEPYTIGQLSSFGEDNDGGLYAVSHSGRIYRIAG